MHGAPGILPSRVRAVDAVERPLRTARQRAAQATVDVEWIQADVAGLASLDAHGSVSPLHDRGCFHDLPDHIRVAYAKAARALAAPDATLLLMSFVPTRRNGPGGATRAEIDERFGQHWSLASVQQDAAPEPSGPMHGVPRLWYQLVRR